MFPTFDKEEILVREHHHPSPLFFALTLLQFPDLTLKSYSSYMVPFEIATCQSQAQRSGGQAEATNLNPFIKLGNTMGRTILYFRLSSSLHLMPAVLSQGWSDGCGEKEQALHLETEGLTLYYVPISYSCHL